MARRKGAKGGPGTYKEEPQALVPDGDGDLADGPKPKPKAHHPHQQQKGPAPPLAHNPRPTSIAHQPQQHHPSQAQQQHSQQHPSHQHQHQHPGSPHLPGPPSHPGSTYSTHVNGLPLQHQSPYAQTSNVPGGASAYPEVNYYAGHPSPYSSAASGQYSASEASESMAAAHMQRPYQTLYTPQSNSPASVASSQSHDQHGRPLYPHPAPQMPGQQMYGYPSYPPMNMQYGQQQQQGPPQQPGLSQQPMLMSHQQHQAQIQHQQPPTAQPIAHNSPRPKLEPNTLQQRPLETTQLQRPPPTAMTPNGTVQAQTPTSNGLHQSPQGPGANVNSSAAPGPIPATTPLVVRQDNNGVQWIAFEYSRDRVKMEYTIRCDVESVDYDAMNGDFKTENCVYPRAYCNKDQYRGNRLQYESECNNVGWALAELNPCLRGKRGLIQRAVDSWRNSNQDPKLRSRRVRRMAKMNTRTKSSHSTTPQLNGPSGVPSTVIPPGGVPQTPDQASTPILQKYETALQQRHQVMNNMASNATMQQQQQQQQQQQHHHHNNHTDGPAQGGADDTSGQPRLRPSQVFSDYASYPSQPSPAYAPSTAPRLPASGAGMPGGKVSSHHATATTTSSHESSGMILPPLASSAVGTDTMNRGTKRFYSPESTSPVMHHASTPTMSVAAVAARRRREEQEDLDDPSSTTTPYDLHGNLPPSKRRKFILVDDNSRPVGHPSNSHSSSAGGKDNMSTSGGGASGAAPGGGSSGGNNRVRVRVSLEQVNMAEMPDSYRRGNSVFPRAWFPVQMVDTNDDDYTGTGLPASRDGYRGRYPVYNNNRKGRGSTIGVNASGGAGWRKNARSTGEDAQIAIDEADLPGQVSKAVVGRTTVRVPLLEAGDEQGDDMEMKSAGTTSARTRSSEWEIAVPQVTRGKARRERVLNELGYRMSWSQSRVFAGRILFLQKALDAYRNKTRSTLLNNYSSTTSGTAVADDTATSSPSRVADPLRHHQATSSGGNVPSTAPPGQHVPAHFETRVGKRMWRERKRRSDSGSGVAGRKEGRKGSGPATSAEGRDKSGVDEGGK